MGKTSRADEPKALLNALLSSGNQCVRLYLQYSSKGSHPRKTSSFGELICKAGVDLHYVWMDIAQTMVQNLPQHIFGNAGAPLQKLDGDLYDNGAVSSASNMVRLRFTGKAVLVKVAYQTSIA